MPDFNVRADSVNVEQIMEQIRARIREKRGVDYTEQELRELAAVKLEKFLDPRGVRSDLLEQFRRMPKSYTPPPMPSYTFGDETLYETHRGALRFIRRLLQPILKLFFNPNPLIMALHVQTDINALNVKREEQRELLYQDMRELQYEVLHNLVVEVTRLGIEMKNLKMRVESLTSRLEFNERRARALESVVVYSTPAEDDAIPMLPADRTAPEPGMSQMGQGGALIAESAPAAEGPGQRSRRRRRRRGRRGAGGPGSVDANGAAQSQAQTVSEADEPSMESDDELDHRVVRAEPLEQVMAVSSHPAEQVSREPDPSVDVTERENPRATVPPPGGPADNDES
jgi:hypothetical protein